MDLISAESSKLKILMKKFNFDVKDHEKEVEDKKKKEEEALRIAKLELDQRRLSEAHHEELAEKAAARRLIEKMKNQTSDHPGLQSIVACLVHMQGIT